MVWDFSSGCFRQFGQQATLDQTLCLHPAGAAVAEENARAFGTEYPVKKHA